MRPTPKEVECLTEALHCVQKAQRLQEVLDLQDKTRATSRYKQHADVGNAIIDVTSVVNLVAERRLGELLRNTELAKASPGNQHTGRLDRSQTATGPIFLKELGISKSRSSRAQELAGLPREAFNDYLSDAMKSGRPPTVAGAVKIAKQLRASERAQLPENMPTGFVTNLQTLLDDGRKFSTIVADPPWRHDNQASRASASNHYPTMSLEEICHEPLAELATKNAHLHLWATSPLLPEALTVMESWGFTYKSSCCWLKPQIGMGNYWRICHEFLLLGVRGKLSFLDHAQRSCLAADRTKHSAKPPEFRELVEKVSPGPYLEMYGRTPPLNSHWTVFGNELSPEERE